MQFVGMRMFALHVKCSKTFLWYILHKKSRERAVLAVDHDSCIVFYGNQAIRSQMAAG